VKPGQAAAVAELYARSVGEARTFYEKRRPDVAPLFFRFQEQSALGDHRTIEGLGDAIARLNLLPGDVGNDLVMTGQDIGALALWARHRTVMAVDDDLWAALGESDGDTFIPEGLFEQLPYPDPFLAFPDPLVLPLEDGGHMRIGGVYLSGRSALGQCSTHDELCGGLGLLIGAETYREDGSRALLPDGTADMLWTRVSLADGGSLNNMIELSAEGFVSIAVDGTAWREQMPLMVRRAMSVIVYLCAENADLRPVVMPGAPAKKTRGRTGKRAPRTTVVEVGFQVGAALRAWRRTDSDTRGHTGRHVRPHIRRSHFHTYRVGPGRQQTRVKWLAPIPINIDGPADRPTVHPVRKDTRNADHDGHGSPVRGAAPRSPAV
jgi:hypothetical protein